MKILLITKIIFFIVITTTFSYAVELQLSGSLSEMYDDNINSSEDKESDFITEITAGIGLIHEGRTINWHLLGESTQQIYLENSDLNNNSQTAELAIAKEIFYNDNISITDTFGHYPEPGDFQDMFGQLLGRSDYLTNTFTAIYTNYLLRSFFFSLEYNNIYIKSLSGDTLDSVSNNGIITFGLEMNSFNIISIFYSYTNRKILEESDTESETTILHECGLEYLHYFTRRFSGNLEGGFEQVETEDETNYTFSSALTLTHQIDENNTIELSASKEYEMTILTNEVYDIWNFTADFNRELSRLTSFSLSFFYQYGNNVSPATAIESKLIGLETGFTYNFSEHISSDISYTYTYNQTEQTEPVDYYVKYDRNQIQIEISAVF
ncbi:MAG: hypothetical protein JW864_10180 [Spirochaetes bacterium]|nr:hypothetical protein [Spirochaetota bacterium]